MNEPRSTAPKLLILDNDEAILELAAWFLTRKGYAVRTATSFQAALLLMDQEWPDLLLSDIDLGHESGAEELPRLSREGRLPPTLVVSGYLDLELATRLSALPQVLGTIVKPFDLPVLEERIASCLSSARSVLARPASVPEATPRRSAIEEWMSDRDGWVEIQPYDPAARTPRGLS